MTELILREAAPFTMTADVPAQTPDVRAAGGVAFALVNDLAGLEGLEADWNALFARAGRPTQAFQTFNWCWHWCLHYLGQAPRGPALAIVTGRVAGRLVLLMPLALQRRAGVSELVWLGEPVSQYGDCIAEPEAAKTETLLAAWRFAINVTKADVANLRKVRADATAAALLARLGTTITGTEEAPYMNFSGDDSFAAWEKRRQPKAQKNRRRQARRLAETGNLSFVCQQGSEVGGALARHAAHLKRETLDTKGAISPAVADPRFAAFFSDAVGDAARPTGAHVRALISSDTPAALKVLIACRDTSLLHIAVFDPKFGKCGAGAVLLEHVIDQSIAAGVRTLDLLAPRHDYKMDFADGVVLVHDHALALTPKGHIYARVYLGLRQRMKAAVEALPVTLRKLLGRIAA